jgi:predicted MFS family arabinose efflux permease
MSPTLRLGAFGFALIAVCYGLARFAFGLFLPTIGGELELGTTLAGVISGGSFAGYCVAILASAALTERLGPKPVAIGAAAVAAIGMTGIAFAPDAIWLAGAVMLAGCSTGLASPPLAAAIALSVPEGRRDPANTFVNAGTSVGVGLSGVIALLIAGEWRLAFAGFAAAAFILAFAAYLTVPGGPPKAGAAGGWPSMSRPLLGLIAAALLMGAASTSIWSFGGQLAALNLGWQDGQTGILWTVIGVCGIAGAGAGSLVGRYGIGRVHWVFLALMAAGTVAVGASFSFSGSVLFGGALFGASYVLLSGVYLIWGLKVLPDRPATGLMVGFLMMAVGQTIGAPVFGLLLYGFGTDTAVFAFSLLGMAAGLTCAGEQFSSQCPRLGRTTKQAALK